MSDTRTNAFSAKEVKSKQPWKSSCCFFSCFSCESFPIDDALTPDRSSNEISFINELLAAEFKHVELEKDLKKPVQQIMVAPAPSSSVEDPTTATYVALAIINDQIVKELRQPLSMARVDIIKDELENNISTKVNCFYQKKMPAISVIDYLERLAKYLQLVPADLLHIGIYLLRYLENNTDDFLNELNIHRLFLAATLAYLKYIDYDDQNQLPKETNAYVAEVGGVSLSELNRMEVEFLFTTGFDLYVDCDYSTLTDEKILSYLKDPQTLNSLAFPALIELGSKNIPIKTEKQLDAFPFSPSTSPASNIVEELEASVRSPSPR